jgi:hypothetical protein
MSIPREAAMTAQSTDLYRVAMRLDESPEELLNGGAITALHALDALPPEAAASKSGVEVAEVKALWDRAGARLREVPGSDELYPAAAEAANLLYAAAWVAGSNSLTVDDLRTLM